MKPKCQHDLLIRPVLPDKSLQAIWLVNGGRATRATGEAGFRQRAGQAAAMFAAARSGKLSLSGLLEARRGPQLVGAAWANIMPGRTALVWPAQLITGETEETADRLHAELARFAAERGAVLSQAVLDTDHGPAAERLERAGYSHVADLLYLLSLSKSFAAEPQTDRLTFRAYQDADRPALAALVERTYVGSLDCPAVDGLRRIEDVLDGYQGTATFRPDLWLTAIYEDQPIGCVLLADHPQQRQLELVYLGVIPEARGRGFGTDMTRHVQWLAGTLGRDRIVLAVDAENQPALEAYARSGFNGWDRRSLFLRVPAEGGPAERRS